MVKENKVIGVILNVQEWEDFIAISKAIYGKSASSRLRELIETINKGDREKWIQQITNRQ